MTNANASIQTAGERCNAQEMCVDQLNVYTEGFEMAL